MLNVLKKVVLLQPFFIQFTRFLSKTTKNTLKQPFYLNLTEAQTLLEDQNKNCRSKEKDGKTNILLFLKQSKLRARR